MNLFFILASFCLMLYQNCSPFKSLDKTVELDSFGGFEKCSPEDPRNPYKSPLKRITKTQLRNMIIDLFSVADSQFDYILTILDRDYFPKYPNDEMDRAMDSADQEIHLEHAQYMFLLSEYIVGRIWLFGSERKKVVGDCYGSTDENCSIQFIKDFGKKVFRRPLTDEDVEIYKSIFAGLPADYQYQGVIVAMLNSPQFFYLLEFGDSQAPDGQNSEGDVVNLGPYELASKLSFLLRQSFPDPELFAAAEDKSILTQAGFSAQVERLFKDPTVKRRMSEAIGNEWLGLSDSPTVRTDIRSWGSMFENIFSEVYEPDLTISAEDEVVRRRMTKNKEQNQFKDLLYEEVYQYLQYMIFEQQASFNELMTSDLVFPTEGLVAKIYKTPIWNGDSSLDQLVRAPAGERAGVLTRAGLLFTGDESTRPILRGVGVYRNFLCGELELPPDNSAPDSVVLTDDMSEREHTQALTEVPGTSCVGCHQNIINPLGLSFENFDSFGRNRSIEDIYYPEDNRDRGQVWLSKPVNSQTRIDLPEMLTAEVNGLVDLAQALSVSPRAHACFSYKMWNLTQRQNVTFNESGCAVETIFRKSDQSVLEVFRAITQQPEFKKRRIQ